MNVVDEIAYLSEKGYESLYERNYPTARQYFINAASIAFKLIKSENFETHEDLKYIANSLVSLARSAQVNKFDVEPVQSETLQKRNDSKNKKKQSLLVKTNDVLEKVSLENAKEARNKGNLSIPLGISLENSNMYYWEPEMLMNGIMTITGGSGSGKTETLKTIALKLIENKIPCILLDLHGDLELDISSISLDYRGQYSINPLELTSKSEKDGGPLPQINRLMSQFSYAIKDRFSPSQNLWLRNLLKFSYLDHGIIQKDSNTWNNTPPDYKYLLQLIRYPEEKFQASNNSEYIRLLDTITPSTRLAVENRLTYILEHPAFHGDKKIPLKDIVRKSLHIQLKPLNTIDMQFLAADTIMRQIFSSMKSLGHISNLNEKKFRIFIILDEVKILTGHRGKINDPYHILNKMATEARKFGIGLILASQIFAHFGRDIKSNAATKLVLRTMDYEETKHCSKELKIKTDKLMNINTPGEGYIITSEFPNAHHVQIHRSRSID